jgi:hypothetical protein
MLPTWVSFSLPVTADLIDHLGAHADQLLAHA